MTIQLSRSFVEKRHQLMTSLECKKQWKKSVEKNIYGHMWNKKLNNTLISDRKSHHRNKKICRTLWGNCCVFGSLRNADNSCEYISFIQNLKKWIDFYRAYDQPQLSCRGPRFVIAQSLSTFIFFAFPCTTGFGWN